MKLPCPRPTRKLARSIVLTCLMVCLANSPAIGSQNLERKSPDLGLTLQLDAGRELWVTATISPVDFTRYGFHEQWDELADLKAAVPRKKYGAHTFEAFLPSKSVAVGDAWELKDDVIHLIRQLHANATLDMHASDASGGWAMLRASNHRFAEVAFRIHADIPLERGYLTFSQFTGRLVIDHMNEEIVFFRMSVPNATINFDVHWQPAPEQRGYMTDAGRCRHVELVSGHRAVADAIKWAERVSRAKVELELASNFYAAWQIQWQPLEQALNLARRLNKPIHVVSADGPFKDESC